MSLFPHHNKFKRNKQNKENKHKMNKNIVIIDLQKLREEMNKIWKEYTTEHAKPKTDLRFKW